MFIIFFNRVFKNMSFKFRMSCQRFKIKNWEKSFFYNYFFFFMLDLFNKLIRVSFFSYIYSIGISMTASFFFSLFFGIIFNYFFSIDLLFIFGQRYFFIIFSLLINLIFFFEILPILLWIRFKMKINKYIFFFIYFSIFSLIISYETTWLSYFFYDGYVDFLFLFSLLYTFNFTVPFFIIFGFLYRNRLYDPSLPWEQYIKFK